jgi:hypothetical protein
MYYECRTVQKASARMSSCRCRWTYLRITRERKACRVSRCCVSAGVCFDPGHRHVDKSHRSAIRLIFIRKILSRVSAIIGFFAIGVTAMLLNRISDCACMRNDSYSGTDRGDDAYNICLRPLQAVGISVCMDTIGGCWQSSEHGVHSDNPTALVLMSIALVAILPYFSADLLPPAFTSTYWPAHG